MTQKSRRPQRKTSNQVPGQPGIQPATRTSQPFEWVSIPVTYQELTENAKKAAEAGGFDPYALRSRTMREIEDKTGRPLICYVARTWNVPGKLPFQPPVQIEDADLIGFGDLVSTSPGDGVDVFLVSNGGSAEATERIVNLLRGNYGYVRFILPANAYSAATLMAFAGDTIVMDRLATLGPIDPQLNGIPTRAFLRAFEAVQQAVKEGGPQALTAYMPLLAKYDLHILEICKSAEQLSAELAGKWLSQYMFKCDSSDSRVAQIVDFFSSHDKHKSHARSIDRDTARNVGLNVSRVEDDNALAEHVHSLYIQYDWFFDHTPFLKLFENSRGVSWGRQLPVASEPIAPSSGER